MIINYNFDTVNDIANYVVSLEKMNKKDNKMDMPYCVNVVAHYEIIRNLIIEAVKLGMDISQIDIADYEWEGYEDEYVFELSENSIIVEKAKRSKGYFHVDEDFTLVHKDVSDDFFEINEKTNAMETFSVKEYDGDLYQFGVSNGDEFEENDKNEKIIISDDGHSLTYKFENDHGFYFSYYYNSKGLTDKDIENFLN